MSFPEAWPTVVSTLTLDGRHYRFSDGGYAALGQLIADVTGLPYADAATRLVLEPLGDERLVVPGQLARQRCRCGHRHGRWPGHLALTNRRITIEPVIGQVRHSISREP
jgi:CubicO group peptidase (beta-lactamase class C family)